MRFPVTGPEKGQVSLTWGITFTKAPHDLQQTQTTDPNHKPKPQTQTTQIQNNAFQSSDSKHEPVPWQVLQSFQVKPYIHTLAWDAGILVSSRNWNIPRITWSIIPIVQESKGHAKNIFGATPPPKKKKSGKERKRNEGARQAVSNSDQCQVIQGPGLLPGGHPHNGNTDSDPKWPRDTSQPWFEFLQGTQERAARRRQRSSIPGTCNAPQVMLPRRTRKSASFLVTLGVKFKWRVVVCSGGHRQPAGPGPMEPRWELRGWPDSVPLERAALRTARVAGNEEDESRPPATARWSGDDPTLRVDSAAYPSVPGSVTVPPHCRAFCKCDVSPLGASSRFFVFFTPL